MKRLLAIFLLLVAVAANAADVHFSFNRNLPHGYQLGVAVENLRTGREQLNVIYGVMTQMCDDADANGSPDCGSAANFTTHVTKFGFGTTAEAKGAYDEMGSFLGKINSDGSQTNVKAAWDQVVSRFNN